jgi:hypothetical protein
MYQEEISIEELNYSGNSIIIQYWFPHLVNNLSNVPGVLAGNYHEGDVENATLVLAYDEEGGIIEPIAMILSKHYSGSWAIWEEIDKQIANENMTNHPIIYIENGSHANFFSENANEMTHSTGNSEFHQGRGCY